jgi:hypothetical protein
MRTQFRLIDIEFFGVMVRVLVVIIIIIIIIGFHLSKDVVVLGSSCIKLTDKMPDQEPCLGQDDNSAR